jgi:parallel beta-helix repeat protein
MNSSEISGTISTDTTWNKAGSPYIISGIVRIAHGATLTIEPGTVIDGKEEQYFSQNGMYAPASIEHAMYVEGTLVARGSKDNPIVITSKAGAIYFNESSTSWDEQRGSGSIMEYVNKVGTIAVLGSSPKLAHIFTDYIEIDGGAPLIFNNNIHQLFDYGGAPIISGNFIGGINYYTFNEFHDTVNEGSPVITNNIVRSGIWISGRSPLILNNIINGSVEINCHSGNPVISDNFITASILRTSDGIWLNGQWTVNDPIILPGINVLGNNQQVTISGNVIKNGCGGINVTSTGTTIIEDNMIYNSSIGIYITTSASIKNNNFQNNAKYSVYLKTANDITASNNWWGTTDSQAINQKVYDHQDFSDYGRVTVTPFLTTPNLDAPTLDFNPLTTPLDIPAASPTPAPTVAPTSMPTAPPDPHQTTPCNSPTVLPEQTAPQTVAQTNISLDSVFEVTIVALLLVIIGLVFVVFKRLPSKPRI